MTKQPDSKIENTKWSNFKGSLSTTFLASNTQRTQSPGSGFNMIQPLPSINSKQQNPAGIDPKQTVFLVRPLNRPVTELVAEKLKSKFEGEKSIRDSDGKLIPYMILGDTGEFEEMEDLMKRGESPSRGEGKEDVTKNPIEEEYAKKEQELDSSFVHYLQQQEKALDNWTRHQEKWQAIEQMIARKMNTDPSTLMMSKVEQYRLLVEDKILMEETFRVMEKGMVDWKTYYRVGNDLTGLMRPVVQKADKDLEYIRSQNQSYKPLNHFKNWDVIEGHKDPIKSLIPDLSIPQMGYVEYFDVQGKKINGSSAESAVHSVTKSPDSIGNGSARINRSVSFDANAMKDTHGHSTARKSSFSAANDMEYGGMEDAVIIEETLIEPNTLRLSTNHLYFESYTNEIACMKASLINEGSTSIHYEWVRESKNEGPGAQNFYFYRKRGVILPGETIEIQVGFKSAAFGMYREAWKLQTLPNVDCDSGNCLVLTLKGIALEMDKSKHKRDVIEKRLIRLQAESAASHVFECVLQQVWHIHNLNNQSAPKSKEEKMFIRQNHHMSHRVYYSPSNFAKFENLALRIHEAIGGTFNDAKPFKWDCSIDNLYQATDEIQDRKLRHQFIKELNDLVRLASILVQKPIIRSFYQTLSYDVISELCDKISLSSESLRTKRALPLDRPCVQKFSQTLDESGQNDDDNAEAAVSSTGKPGPESNSKTAAAKATDKKAAETAAKGKPGKAPPPKAAPAPAAKSGKKNEASAQEDANAAANKIEIKKEVWSKERKMNEAMYRVEFKQKVKELVQEAISRMDSLLLDAAKLAPKGLH